MPFTKIVKGRRRGRREEGEKERKRQKDFTRYNECCCSITMLCPTLCDPMDCSPSGSSVHGISQARILEWVAISFSRGSFQGLILHLLCWQATSLSPSR